MSRYCVIHHSTGLTLIFETAREMEKVVEETLAVLIAKSCLTIKLDGATCTHQINLYLVDNAIGFLNTYPLHSDLSGG